MIHSSIGAPGQQLTFKEFGGKIAKCNICKSSVSLRVFKSEKKNITNTESIH